MTCKYIKKEGAGCSLNNNCRYPKCISGNINMIYRLREKINKLFTYKTKSK